MSRYVKHLTTGLAMVLGLSVCACDGEKKPQTHQIQVKASGAVRSIEATEELDVEELAAGVSVSISSKYKAWSKDASTAIDIAIKNTSSKHAPAITLPVFNIYSADGSTVLAYARLDLANGYALGPRRTSVLSIPVGQQKSLITPVKRLEWFEPSAPEVSQDLYLFLKPGHYKLKLEISVFDVNDVEVSKLSSEFLDFELLQSF